jgi:hypothetical protein
LLRNASQISEAHKNHRRLRERNCMTLKALRKERIAVDVAEIRAGRDSHRKGAATESQRIAKQSFEFLTRR